MRTFVLFLIVTLAFFFGCTHLLTKKDVFPPSEIQPTEPVPYYRAVSYLRYYNFQQFDPQTREAQLEVLNSTHEREIQALLLPGESFSFKTACGQETIVYFNKFIDPPSYNLVHLIVTQSGKSQTFNLSREDHSVLLFSCQNISKSNELFTTRAEAPVVIVGEKHFIIDNDTMTDEWCFLRQSIPQEKPRIISEQDWYRGSFYYASLLKRYLFRPNTRICDGDTDYILAENNDSKQCYTYLEKRPANSVGCRNLEGSLDQVDVGDTSDFE